MQFEVSAPTRIDIAGGTLDLWPIHQLVEQATTVNIGVTLRAKATVNKVDGKSIELRSIDQDQEVKGDFSQMSALKPLPLLRKFVGALWQPDWPGFTLETSAGSPAGAGLGGSSCLALCVVKALDALRHDLGLVNAPLSEAEIVAFARDVEANLIQIPTGEQDYWGAMRGSVNIMSYPPGRVSVETLDGAALEYFQERLILCYSGVSRSSATNNWEIFRAFFDGDKTLRGKLAEIAAAAASCASALHENKPEMALQYSQQEWGLRTALWPAIETQETKSLASAAVGAGAMFSRVCGAGGGGVMAIFAEPSDRDAVCRALEGAGGKVLDARIATEGQSCIAKG